MRHFLIGGLLALSLNFAGSVAPAQGVEPVTLGQIFLAGSLDPAEGSAGWALVSHGIAETLFTVSREGQVMPRLAVQAERTGALRWEVTLAAGRFFSDGTPVTAEAVASALNRTGEMNPAARASAGRLTVEQTGPLTLTIETERPTPVLPSVLAEWAMPVYRLSDAGPVFTGPYAVTAFEPGARMSLTPNPHYPRADERPEITLLRVADGQTLALGLMAGELDLAFNLPVEMLPMIAARDDLAVQSFPVEYQYMMWMNTRRGPLADVRVRQAIDRAISRSDLARAVRAGVPATGAFPAHFPFAAEAGTVTDPAEAARLLDEAGWTLANGQRVKDGQPLALTLWAYPQRPDLITFQPVIRAALEDLGISVETRVAENASDAARAGAFDLFLWAQHTAPAGDPAFFLSLFLGEHGANNYSGWADPAFEATLAELFAESDPASRARIAQRAQAVIAEGAPVAFLLTPEWHVGLSDRIAEYQAWGSDFYIIRDDFALSPPP
ncbi:MAG: ABC transporter substrate-binding protein [Pararhodobacter sp.]